ncbi:MAG: Cd(II)/Pb(II)-responsive transcriptional regulator [Betaproteobacteria bacterium]|nr:Cd(II)/Pb(II)-responsive transcriptional regulator [Betaproteobacteria bacterium]
MKIGEVAKLTNTPVDTIRFYEREGLIAAPDRRENGYRTYGQSELERLSFIRHCRALDMPLAEIRLLVDFTMRPRQDCKDVDAIVEEQLKRVKARLKSMRALEKQLEVLRARCDSHHSTAECGILQELVAAAHGEACACHPNEESSPANRKLRK